jgi:hypothetical protein
MDGCVLELTPIIANMRVITGVYMHCRQDLRDEWLIGGDQETDSDDALASVTGAG